MFLFLEHDRCRRQYRYRSLHWFRQSSTNWWSRRWVYEWQYRNSRSSCWHSLALVIDWIIMGIMLLNTCQAIGEMAMWANAYFEDRKAELTDSAFRFSMYPVSGGFYTLVSRFVDASWGFAMGWNYVRSERSSIWVLGATGGWLYLPHCQVFQWAVVLPLEVSFVWWYSSVCVTDNY